MARLRIDIPPLRACGKRRHYTLGEAERHLHSLASVERGYRPSLPTLKVYHCRQCDAYHVGHSS